MQTDSTQAAVKETKAQRIEKLKREKNAWECLDEIGSFAQQGDASILPEIERLARWREQNSNKNLPV